MTTMKIVILTLNCCLGLIFIWASYSKGRLFSNIIRDIAISKKPENVEEKIKDVREIWRVFGYVFSGANLLLLLMVLKS